MAMFQGSQLNLQEFKAFAESFIHSVNGPPAIILLNGPMGAGKTQFLRFCLASLGVKDVASPTYAIHHEYLSSHMRVDHFDLYRLEDDEDLESTGFWDILNAGQSLVFIEWAERLDQSTLPAFITKWDVSIQMGSSSDRRNIQIVQLKT